MSRDTHDASKNQEIDYRETIRGIRNLEEMRLVREVLNLLITNWRTAMEGGLKLGGNKFTGKQTSGRNN